MSCELAKKNIPRIINVGCFNIRKINGSHLNCYKRSYLLVVHCSTVEF